MKPISARILACPDERIVSIETARLWCDVVPIDSDGHPHDSLILGFVDAATDLAEKFTGRSILLRTYEFALDDFPRLLCAPPNTLQPGIEVPYPPLIEILYFTFTDDSDGELDQDVNYVIDQYGDKAVLRPMTTWPSLVTPAPNRVKCGYRAGFQSEANPDSDAEPVPGGILTAINLLVASMYDRKGEPSEDAWRAAQSFLRPWRVLTGMA